MQLYASRRKSMSIVKFRNQSGVLYAYDYTSEVDPDTGKSHQVRKYLGRVDEDTGEIIKTTGKKGRPPKDTYSAPSRKKESTPASADENINAESLQLQIDHLQDEVNSLKQQNLNMQKLLEQFVAGLRNNLS